MTGGTFADSPATPAGDGGPDLLAPASAAWWAALWVAFLSAGVLELLVFSLVDPLEIHAAAAAGWSRQGVYTAAFFAFWAVGAAGGALLLMLSRAGR